MTFLGLWSGEPGAKRAGVVWTFIDWKGPEKEGREEIEFYHVVFNWKIHKEKII